MGTIYAPSTCWRFQSPTVIDMPQSLVKIERVEWYLLFEKALIYSFFSLAKIGLLKKNMDLPLQMIFPKGSTNSHRTKTKLAEGLNKFFWKIDETNSSHLKIGGWKMKFPFGMGLFSGAMLVLGSGNVYTVTVTHFERPKFSWQPGGSQSLSPACGVVECRSGRKWSKCQPWGRGVISTTNMLHKKWIRFDHFRSCGSFFFCCAFLKCMTFRTTGWPHGHSLSE